MTSFFSLKKTHLFFILALSSCLLSNTLSPPISIENPYSFVSTPFPCYNFLENNYLLTWNNLEGFNNYVYTSIYDPNGNILIPAFDPFNSTFNPQNTITSCYNTKNNQFMIAWYEYNLGGVTYAFLNSKGNLINGPFSFENTPTWGNINICFNSLTNQYFLSWAKYTTGIDYPLYFAIINNDGSVFKEATAINCPNSVAANGGNINCCFNTYSNQYLVAWTSSNHPNPYFSLISADGTALQNDIPIPGEPLSYKSIATCYNSRNNEFFLTWFDTLGRTYFCTLDSSGRLKTPSTLVPGLVFDIYYDLYCSFNPVNNTFLISGPNIPHETSQSQFCVISSKGEYVVAPTTLNNPTGYNSSEFTFSSFGSKNDSFFMTRFLIDPILMQTNAYLQIFTQTPFFNSSKNTANKKTCFPIYSPTKPGKSLL